MKTENSQLTQLLRLELRDNGKKYLTWIGIILIALAALTCFAGIQGSGQYNSKWPNSTTDPMHSMMSIMFWIGIVSAGCIFSAQVFSPLESKGGAISNLMLPATQLDKYLVRWFLFVPMFIVLYVACFELVDLMRYILIYYKIPDTPKLHLIRFDFMPNGSLELCASIVFPLLLTSFFVLGSAIWPKRGFTYTALWLAALIGAVTLCFAMYYAFLISGDHLGEPSHRGRFDSEKFGWFMTALAFIGILVNYILAYFRYKEAEILHRW